MKTLGDATPHVRQRIHIAPVGFEVDRVVQPILRMRGELAYIVANLPAEDQASTFRTEVLRQLKARRVKTKVCHAEIFDLYTTIRLILHLLRRHRQEDSFVNVSSGSKVQAIAGLIAAMLAQHEGISVTPYYAEAEAYVPPAGKPISEGCTNIREMPRLHLQTPSSDLIVALEILGEKPMTKSALAIRLAKRAILDSSKLAEDGTPKDESSRVSLQVAADQRVIRRLLEWDFASVKRSGNKAIVTLTDDGRAASSLYSATDEVEIFGEEDA